MNWLEGKFRKLGNPWKKFGLGSIILSLSIFLLPPLYGEGYESITRLLSGHPDVITDGSIFYPWRDNFWVVFMTLAFNRAALKYSQRVRQTEEVASEEHLPQAFISVVWEAFCLPIRSITSNGSSSIRKKLRSYGNGWSHVGSNACSVNGSFPHGRTDRRI